MILVAFSTFGATLWSHWGSTKSLGQLTLQSPS
jgi:hypothetical protein